MRNRFYLLIALLIFTATVQAQFTALNGPFGGSVQDLERDGSGNTYAVVGSKLYKSSNNGDSWASVNMVGASFIYDITFSNNKLFAVYFNVVYSSVDGVTWTRTATTFPFANAYRIIKFGGNGFLAVYGTEGVFVTKDEGVTWQKALGDRVYYYGYERAVATSNGDLYVISRNSTLNNFNGFEIKKLAYPGVNGSFDNPAWQIVYTNSGSEPYSALLAHDNNVYLFNQSDVLISQNNGGTWASIKGNITSTCMYGYGDVNPFNGAVFYYNQCQNQIYSLVNPTPTSNTWNILSSTSINNSSTSIVCWSFNSASSILAGSSSAGVFKSTDSGANYSLSSNGMAAGTGRAITITNSGNKMIYLNSTFSRGYWLSSDSGVTWSFVATSNSYSKIKKLADGTILLYGNSYIARSTDNLSTPIVETFQANVDIVEASNGTLYAASGTSVFSSVDKGATWSSVVISGTWPASHNARFISDDADNIYVNTSLGSAYKLLRIKKSDGVITDLSTYPAPTSNLSNLFSVGNKIYAIQTNTYFFSTDQGVNWETVGFSGSAVFPISDGVNTAICVGRPGNLYTSQDDGKSWNSIALPNTTSFVTGLVRDPASTVSNPVYYASANSSAALKFTGKIIVDPLTLPEYIDFNWQDLGGPYGGGPSDHEFHPDGTQFTILNGVMFSNSSGSWTRMSNISSSITLIYDIEVDSDGKIYALIGSGSTSTPRIYVSSDKGTTWSARAGTFFIPNSYFIGIRLEKLSNGHLIVFANGSRIFRSTDDANTFTAVKTTGTNSFSTAAPILKNSSLLTGHNSTDGILISTDNGATWEQRNSGLPLVNNFYQIVNLAIDNANTMLVATLESTQSNGTIGVYEVYKSVDQGLNWVKLTTPTPLTAGGNPLGAKRISIMPNGDYLLSISTVNELYKSIDGGNSWVKLSFGSDFFAGYYERSGEDIYLRGGVNGFFKSSDNGNTFMESNSGLPRLTSVDIEILENEDLIVSSQQPFHSSNSGQTWERTSDQLTGRFLVKGDSIIAYGGRYNLLSIDHGKNWSVLGSERFFSLITTADNKSFYAVANSTTVSFGLFFSTDLVNWTPVSVSGLPTTYSYQSISLDNNGVLYAVINSAAGLSLYQIAFETANKIENPITPSSPRTVLFHKGKIYVYDGIGTIYTKTDGQDWETLAAPAGSSLIITKNDYLFIPGTNSVLWLSRDGGGTWQNVGLTFTSGTNFQDVVINELDGFAYATLTNSVVKKSQVIVIPDDKTAPVVSVYEPAQNAANVSLSPQLRLTFNEAVKAVAGKKFRIFDLANPNVSLEIIDGAAATQEGKTIIITPTIKLAFNKTYFVTAESGVIQDIFGNNFTGIISNATWRFTAKASPSVISVSPSGLGITLNTALTVTFSEPTIGVSAKNLLLFKSSNAATPVAAIPLSSASLSGNQMTFAATGLLEFNTAYFVKFDASSFSTLDGGVFSALTQNTDWTFTTVPPPDTQAPVITFTPSNLIVGSGNKVISTTITDNVGVTGAQIFYRSITSNTSATSANLTLTSGKYEATIPESAYGKLGLEFYFLATDAAGNETRSPEAGNHHSYIDFPNATSLPFPASLLGTGGEVSGWKIISIPHKLTDNKVATVFGELGIEDKTKWRLITLKSASAWGEYPADFSTFTQGLGYFVNIKTPVAINIEGASTPLSNKATLFPIALKSGWNQIGNPYPFPIKWSEVLAANTGVLTIGPTKTFNGTSYANKDQIEVFEGAFVFNSGNDQVTIDVPVVSSLSGGRIESENYDLGQENWVLPITVKSGEIENTLGGVGMHRDAQLGIDQHDDFNPPAITDFIQMDFDHPEHFVKASTRDVVPTQDEYKWSFTLKGNIESPTELIWDNTRFGNNSKEVFLYDIDRGILVDMREEQSYRVNPKKSSVIEIYFGENLRSKIKPQRVILGEAYPNPGFGDITIPFTLPEKSASYLVTMEVFDLMGRKITTLVEKSLAPGFYTSHWETTQANLTNGLYTYRMTVVGNDRSEVLNGKVILNQ